MTVLRPRSAIEIVDAAFQVTRLHYAALVTATAVVLAPAMLLGLVLPPAWQRVAGMLQNLLIPIADGAVIAIVSEAYLGRAVDAGTGLRALRGRVGSLVWASIARSFMLVIGFVLLIVPGFIVAAWTFAMPMAITLEGHETDRAFHRSRELARGHVGRVLATLVLLFVIFLFLMMGIGAALGGTIAALGIGEGAAEVIFSLPLIGVYPLVGVGGTLLYYDLRIRKEGFDLEMMAQELGGHTPNAVVAGAPLGGTAPGAG